MNLGNVWRLAENFAVMEFLKRQSGGLKCRDSCFPIGVAKAEAIGQVITIFLMTGSLLLLLMPQVQSLVGNLPCCNGWNGCGTLVILRFSIIYVLFLLFCAILNLVRSFGTQATPSLWCVKMVMIVSGCYASLYIPPPIFDRIGTDFLLFGATTFIVMQMYILIRCSYFVIIKLRRMVENGLVWARRLEIGFFIFGVITPIFAEILLIYYYPLCSINLVFLITNAVVPFIACLWSMSDCVKEKNGYSGFAQGGVFSCFIIFYTWSALANDPDPICNPYYGNQSIIAFRQCLFVVFAHAIYIIAVGFSYDIYVHEIEESISINEKDEEQSDNRVSRKNAITVHEEMVHVYIPKFSSFLCASMMCFVVMSIFDWAPPGISEDVAKDRKNAMWFKLVGCWFSVLFFVTTLYTPSLYGIFTGKCLLHKT